MFAKAGKKNTTHSTKNRLRVLPFKLRTKVQMTNIKQAGFFFAIFIASIRLGFCQNALQFTSANVTPEHAVQLHWASNSNEVYEIDYADGLATNDDGSTTWTKLYDDYPSHGTNTFIADAGNYDATPEIPHPKLSPMRFYRVALIQTNDSPTNPLITIVSPTNGATLSDTITVQVSASSGEILSAVRLYIDGEEQWPSDDNSNFVINTCEYLNGNHVLFATASSESGLEGIANGGVITYGRSVSAYVNVTFNNLISEIGFSQPYFEPALGQTQQVTATFAANCDWTLQIQDASGNPVRNASGSGTSLLFDWDGTGDGETNIPDGAYTYFISAATNGGSFMSMSLSRPSLRTASDDVTQTWALAEGSESPVPLAIYPVGADTNGLTFFKATASEIDELTLSDASDEADTSFAPDLFSSLATSSSQSSSSPERKPTNGVKGAIGTYGILDKTYTTGGFTSAHPATGWPPPLPTLVAIDGQTRTAQTVDYRIRDFHYMANEFDAEMQRATWKRAFKKEDAAWGANDIKKSSLGGSSIFNTCNLGFLMTHGSYGVNNSTGTEDDNIKYTYIWLGANNTVRLSDMDFGSAGTNGLRWMTIFACNILRSANYTSMNNSGLIPVNDNLHLLIAPSTDGYAMQGFGYDYAHNLTANNQTIVDSFNNASHDEYTLDSMYLSGLTLKNAVSYWPACFGDKLSLYSEPDPTDGLQYQQTQVFP